MSLIDYNQSQKIAMQDFYFYALIMAAMRKADTENLEKLREAWPATWAELQARCNAPGGLLDGETR